MVLTFAELCKVSSAVEGSGLALALILGLAGLALRAELDALAVLLLGAYTGVFLFLALLLLHFGPYGQPARASVSVSADARVPAAALVALFALLGGLGVGLAPLAPCWLTLWQDLQAPSLGPTTGGELVHRLFFQLCVVEALALNLYLLAALAATVALLAVLHQGSLTAR